MHIIILIILSDTSGHNNSYTTSGHIKCRKRVIIPFYYGVRKVNLKRLKSFSQMSFFGVLSRAITRINEKHSSAGVKQCILFMGCSNKMNMCEDHVHDMFCEVNVSYSIQRNAHKDILII